MLVAAFSSGHVKGHHKLEHIKPFLMFEPGNDILNGIIPHMTHMPNFPGIREHFNSNTTVYQRVSNI